MLEIEKDILGENIEDKRQIKEKEKLQKIRKDLCKKEISISKKSIKE